MVPCPVNTSVRDGETGIAPTFCGQGGLNRRIPQKEGDGLERALIDTEEDTFKNEDLLGEEAACRIDEEEQAGREVDAVIWEIGRSLQQSSTVKPDVLWVEREVNDAFGGDNSGDADLD